MKRSKLIGIGCLLLTFFLVGYTVLTSQGIIEKNESLANYSAVFVLLTMESIYIYYFFTLHKKTRGES